MGRNKTDSKVKQVTHQNKTRKQTDHENANHIPTFDKMLLSTLFLTVCLFQSEGLKLTAHQCRAVDS